MHANGARRQALLTASASALAAAAAFALFKSVPAAPIYLWALVGVALGWAGTLGHAVATEQRGKGMCIDATGDDTRAVIDSLTQAMGMEMRRAREELLRVDELLAHAIEQLMSAFNSVSDAARRHQCEVELAAAAAAARGTPAAEQLRAAAERVAKDVNGAVTALQFRDVVGQKLGHVRRELETLEQVMLRIREMSAAQPGPAESAGKGGLATRVQDLLRELEGAKAASPAQQELMHAGDVELF